MQAPDVTRERLYIQALENVLSNTSKVLVDTQSSGNMMYLPLDQIMRRGGGASADNSLGGLEGSSSQVDIKSLTDEVLRELRNRQTTNSRTGR